jgi:hypothetical protein
MISVLNRDSTMLTEPSTKNVALGSSGLFHFAILVPDSVVEVSVKVL